MALKCLKGNTLFLYLGLHNTKHQEVQFTENDTSKIKCIQQWKGNLPVWITLQTGKPEATNLHSLCTNTTFELEGNEGLSPIDGLSCRFCH